MQENLKQAIQSCYLTLRPRAWIMVDLEPPKFRLRSGNLYLLTATSLSEMKLLRAHSPSFRNKPLQNEK